MSINSARKSIPTRLNPHAPHLFVQIQIRVAHRVVVFGHESGLFFVPVEKGTKLVLGDKEVTGVTQGAVFSAVVFAFEEKNLEDL
jgi:hypothetical protein